MNKLFTKMALFAVGAGMAVAVGVATTKGSVEAAKADGPITVKYDDEFSPALPASKDDATSEVAAYTDSTASFTFKAASIYKTASAKYIMFMENKGFLYNTVDLGSIQSVSLTYSSGTSKAGKVGVYFGSTEQNIYFNNDNVTISGTSKTQTWNNLEDGKGFFQISSSNKNVQIEKIEIVLGSPEVLTEITGIDGELSVVVGATEWDLSTLTPKGRVEGMAASDAPVDISKFVTLDTDDRPAQQAGVGHASVKVIPIGETSVAEKAYTVKATVRVNPFDNFEKVASLSDVTETGLYSLSNDKFAFAGTSIENNGLTVVREKADCGKFQLVATAEGNGYYLKLTTADPNDASGEVVKYVNGKADKADLKLGDEAETVWVLVQDDNGVFLRMKTEGDAVGRHLGLIEAGNLIKAYAASNIAKNLPVYLYKFNSVDPVGPVDPVDPVDPGKKGCGGNIVTSSVIISTLALAGIALLFLKKKEA